MFVLALQTLLIIPTFLVASYYAIPTYLAPSYFKIFTDDVFGKWIWVDVPGTVCSEGTETGFALNVFSRSKDLVVNFEGGGVCYDYDTCYKNDTAYNIGIPYTEETFVSQKQAYQLNKYGLFLRQTWQNPFYQSSYAWIPYCTGDLHAGNATNFYPPRTEPTYHAGYQNGKLMMQAIKAALFKYQVEEYVERIWISGSSAGGFGAVYQYPNALDIFGQEASISIIADSAESARDAAFYPSLNLQLISQTDCPACNYSNFNTFLPAYAQLKPQNRFAALSYQTDTILPLYENVSFTQLSQEIVEYFTALNALDNAKTFLMEGTSHVTLNSPRTPAVNGLSLATYLQEMYKGGAWSAGM